MEVIDTEAPSGTPDEGGNPTEPVEAATDTNPTAEQLDLSQFDNHVVKITVDGKEELVPAKELPSMAMRQKDYTRKTQELAELRKRLQNAEALAEALDNDPVSTLKALNEVYQTAPNDDPKWDDMDPQEQRVVRLEQELQGMRAQAVRQEIENEFSQLEEAYGDIDRNEVRNFAIRNGLRVTDAYRIMNFDNVRAEQRRLAEEVKVVDSKRQLPQSQGGTQRGAVTPATKGKMLDIRESYQAALKQAGQ